MKRFGLYLMVYTFMLFIVLVTHLAAAESRCVKLERQLDHMKRMLRNARTERTSLLHQQVNGHINLDETSV